MIIQDYEVRTDDEGVGNLLLVTGNAKNMDSLCVLKELFCVCNQYSESISSQTIDSDFSEFCNNCLFKQVDSNFLREKMSKNINKIMDYRYGFVEVPRGSMEEIQRILFDVDFNEIYLLENDYDSLCFQLIGCNSQMLLCWTDVV